MKENLEMANEAPNLSKINEKDDSENKDNLESNQIEVTGEVLNTPNEKEQQIFTQNDNGEQRFS